MKPATTSARAHKGLQSGSRTGQTAGVKMVGDQNKHKRPSPAAVPSVLASIATVVRRKYVPCRVLGERAAITWRRSLLLTGKVS